MYDAPEELRVLAVTAHGLDEDRARAREAGCDGYLVKPIDPQASLDEIARLVPDGPQGPSPEASSGMPGAPRS